MNIFHWTNFCCSKRHVLCIIVSMLLTVEGDSLSTSGRELSSFVLLVFAGGLLGGLGDQGCGPDSPLAYPGVTSFLVTDVW